MARAKVKTSLDTQAPSTLTVDSMLTRNQAVSLLVKLLNGDSVLTSAEIRSLRDKVGHRLDYALADATKFPTSRPDQVVFGELGAWARSIPDWAESVTSLPVGMGRGVGRADGRSDARATGRGVIFPKDAVDCHREIERLHDCIDDLKRENVNLKHDNDELRVPAEKWQKRMVERNTENARKRRKV